MKKEKVINPIWCVSLLAFCFLFMLLSCSIQEHIKVDSSPANQTTAPTQPPDMIKAGDVPLYDGVLRTMENGDRFYTPSSEHCVTDPESTVLYYNNLLLVFTVRDLTPEEQTTLASIVGGEAIGGIYGGPHAFQILVKNSTLAQLIAMTEELIQIPSVLYACPEYPVQIMGEKLDQNPWVEEPEESLGCEDDPNGLDWWAEAIGAYTAWEYANQCKPIRVGIVDNGFYASHEDLLGQITFVTNENCNNTEEHGTLVAGIIAAVNNDVGIRGIADTAMLYCADLWPDDVYYSYHTMAEYVAVIHSFAQQDVRVVNNSWACIYPEEESWQALWPDFQGNYSDLLELRLTRDLIPTAEFSIILIAQLIEAGYEDMILVQGAGNSGEDARYSGFFAGVTEEVYNAMPAPVLEKLDKAGITYEAVDLRILVAGAVENKRDSDGNYIIAEFSSHGETVDIFAPGMGIFSTIPSEYDFYYATHSGTSLSAPMVTGSVALLWSIDPELSIAQLRQILLESGTVMAVGPGTYPMLNVGAAVQNIID